MQRRRKSFNRIYPTEGGVALAVVGCGATQVLGKGFNDNLKRNGDGSSRRSWEVVKKILKVLVKEKV